ncbi:hypothetical protein BC938DRAFT_477327 [Jimgerdemannia flammicorona]|uniref:Fe2OG dioxygenase domain-containing protein n=1 Tax=Jimgerdemannia flammicorona TaxID=994334 RepID=A0A433QPH3_9FUNG|nr:hypothetical protein BC938DRAFT_477327 [Jimgerdemannia flammicorona]
MDGLTMLPDFITEDEASALIAAIDEQPWSGNGIRYRGRYSLTRTFHARGAHETADAAVRLPILSGLGPLPDFLSFLVDRIVERAFMDGDTPNYLVINEYELGQGIMPHTDATVFGPTIAVVSLLTPCIMNFLHPRTGHSFDLLIPRNSLTVMSRAARYDYKHSISKNHVDRTPEGDEVVRGRRVSLTFRIVKEWSGSEEGWEENGGETGERG